MDQRSAIGQLATAPTCEIPFLYCFQQWNIVLRQRCPEYIPGWRNGSQLYRTRSSSRRYSMLELLVLRYPDVYRTESATQSPTIGDAPVSIMPAIPVSRFVVILPCYVVIASARLREIVDLTNGNILKRSTAASSYMRDVTPVVTGWQSQYGQDRPKSGRTGRSSQIAAATSRSYRFCSIAIWHMYRYCAWFQCLGIARRHFHITLEPFYRLP